MINSSAGFFRSILFIALSCAFFCTSCSSSGSEFISGEYIFAESFNDAASSSKWKPFKNGLIKKNVSFKKNKFLFLKYSFCAVSVLENLANGLQN